MVVNAPTASPLLELASILSIELGLPDPQPFFDVLHSRGPDHDIYLGSYDQDQLPPHIFVGRILSNTGLDFNSQYQAPRSSLVVTNYQPVNGDTVHIFTAGTVDNGTTDFKFVGYRIPTSHL